MAKTGPVLVVSRDHGIVLGPMVSSRERHVTGEIGLISTLAVGITKAQKAGSD